VNTPLFMGSCKYITLHGELYIHHSSWGVVNKPLFMGSCKYITLHGELLIHHSSFYNSPWRVVYLQHLMKSDVFTTLHEEWCIYNAPWRVMYLQRPMKSDVFTTPHEEWCIYTLFMGCCKYITLHGEL
jgi:hypothetical protein